MKITTIKKEIAVAVATVILILASSLSVYAAGENKQAEASTQTQTNTENQADSTEFLAEEIAEAKQSIDQRISRLRDADEERAADSLQIVVNLLDELDNDDNLLQSEEDVKNVIFKIASDKSVLEATGWKNAFDESAAIMQSYWLNQISEVVAYYGINMGEYGYEDVSENRDTYQWWNLGSKQSDQEDALNRTSDTSDAIQRLRWNQTGTNEYSNINITSVLKQFELPFAGFTTMLQSIAAALIIAFGASNLLKMTSDRMIGYDAVLREFFKLIFGVWFIFNYRYFTILILRMGSYITEIFLDGKFTFEASSDSATIASIYRYGLWKSLDSSIETFGTSFMNALSASATGIFSSLKEGLKKFDFFDWICSGGGWMVNISINFVTFAILIELGVRYVFTPIAIADLYSEGSHSNGVRWLKKLFACTLTGALMFLVIYGANIIKRQFGGFNPIQRLALNFTMMGFFSKCRQLADEIVGVR